MSDKYAFPQVSSNESGAWYSNGLTRRELFAAMAMQGFLAGEQPQANAFLGSPNGRSLDVWVAQASIDYADALIAELDRSES